jgi:SAM-dependent methyltransferase
MALVWPVIDIILNEDKKKNFSGEVLFVGKQETFGRELKWTPKIQMRTMDWSPHFGADIVADLGYPVPEDLHNRFDFIYDGGSLDNMFNPAQGLMNIGAMLKPGGRALCLACASAFSTPYTMFSPGWFYDYFEVNNFKSWDIYLCSYSSVETLLQGPWKFHVCNLDNLSRPAPICKDENTHWLVVSIATKGEDSTYNKQPIQYQYIPDQPAFT